MEEAKEMVNGEEKFRRYATEKNLKGWEYQEDILLWAITKNDASGFNLIERNLDFDPMTQCAASAEEIMDTLLKYYENGNQNRGIVLEMYFPVKVFTEKLSINDIDAFLRKIEKLGVHITLLTLELCFKLFSNWSEKKNGEWTKRFQNATWNKFYISEEHDEISSLYMIVHGSGEDVAIGNAPFDEILHMVDITEDYLNRYEDLYSESIILSTDKDSTGSEKTTKNIVSLPERTRITSDYNQSFAIHYNRIISEFIDDLTTNRILYWRTLLYLFSIIKVNPYFVFFDENYKKVELQSRYLTCMMAILWRFRKDISSIEVGKTEYLLYDDHVVFTNRNEHVTTESLDLVYDYFIRASEEQIKLILERYKYLEHIQKLCSKKLTKDDVNEIIDTIGYVIFIQILYFLVLHDNPRLWGEQRNRFLDCNKPLDTFIENADLIAFPVKEMKEDRILFYEGFGYIEFTMKQRYDALKEIYASSERCIRCGNPKA